ncbi:MAG: hypothetical protein JEY99_16805 [Spirochaetales bacterium]|nr:hypothetical protein [Spirochaetales bacterium]
MSDSDKVEKFPCSNCGADLEFKPGTSSLVCPYCQTENTIESSEETIIEEKDFAETLLKLKNQEANEETVDMIVTKCDTCGAEVSLGENQTGGECAFCGAAIVAQGKSEKVLKPESLLPFKVTKNEAAANFKTWLKKRWFAPKQLKQYARVDGLKGIYSPFWTFDSDTETSYSGQRGDYYYTTESYTTTEDGKSVTKTRQVRHTRWRSASGHVCNNFDDILVHASDRMEQKYVDELEPWDLENLAPFNTSYLPGFQVESYSIDLEGGLDIAKDKMASEINYSIRNDIGGDEQRITSKSTSYDNLKFKHILLPVWMSAYNFKGKVYQFMVNARTGEVQGTRPYSAGKIAAAIIIPLVIIAGAVILIKMYG